MPKSGVQRVTRALGAVGGALAVSSVLGYVLLALVARWLPVGQYAVFLSTWGVVFGLGSVLSVVEQEVSRHSAQARASRQRSGFASVQVLLLSSAVALASALAIAVSPLADSVFGGRRVLAVLAIVSTAGFAIQFFVRGILVGHGKLRPYGALLVVEASVRLLAAVLLAFFVATDRLVPMVIAVVVGSFAWVPFVRRTRTLVRTDDGAEPWGRLGKRVLVLAGSSGLTAGLLTGYPALVTAVVGDTAGLGTLFTAISATRIPLVLLSPVQALAVPAVIHLVRAGRGAELRRYLVRGGAALALTAVVGAAAAAVVGPAAIEIFFSEKYRPTSLMVAVLTASTVVIAGVLLEGAALVAFQRYTAVLMTWGAAVAAALLVLVAWPGDAVVRGIAGLAAASVVGALVGTVALLRATRGAHPGRAGRP